MSTVAGKKIAHSVSWGMIETLSVYIVRFFIGIVIARLLTPGDYGLIGMITIFLSVSDVFVNAGFGQAYIQKKNAGQVDANTVFLINFILGCTVYAAFWFLAPVIADFFNQPILTILVRVFFVIIIINSLNVIQQSIIRKELQFKRRAILTVISSVTSGVIGIVCAYSGLGVWSLVIQQISSKTILCILLYSTSPWRLTFRFSSESARSMFGYGAWLLLSNLIGTIFNQFYRFFVGKAYSPDKLGLYERGHQFESMIADTFSWVFGQVCFPVIAKIQDDIDEVRRKMNGFIRFSCFVVFPLLAILFVVAKPMIIILLTEKWVACVPLLQCFCVVGLMSPLYTFLSPLLQGLGHSRWDMTLTAFVCVGRIINVCISYNFGLQYIVLGDFAVLLLAVVAVSLLVNRKIHYNYLTTVFGIKWVMISTLLATLAGWLLSGVIANVYLQLFVPAVVMGVVYLAVIYVADRTLISSLVTMILKKKKNENADR